ncbi:hypothetical protein Tco_0742404 [Tanacetum coccineum]
MWRSIEKSPYVRPMIPNPDKPTEQILEPLSKMTEGNKKQYIADVRVMNYLLQAIPNDIYNSVDVCKNAKDMWGRIKRLMFGSDVINHIRHSRLMDEFDKFTAKEGESLESVYEKLTTLVNIMDRNKVRPIQVAINTKFINCLKPECNKYVTMIRHDQTGDVVSYDELYDSLVQFEPHVQASIAKKATKNHDLLALIAHSNVFLSQSHANSSYSPQPYYVTHPSSDADYEDEYQGELQGDSQEDKLITAMMMVELIYKPRMQVMVEMVTGMHGDKTGIEHLMQEHGMMKAIRLFSVFHEVSQIWERQMFSVITVYAHDSDDNAVFEPSYDAKAVSEVNASTKIHEQVNRVKQNNGGTSEHDSTAHDEYHNIEMLAHNVQREAKNQKRLNNELKKKKQLLQKELEKFKDRVKTFDSKTIQCSKYKETYEELEREIHADKDTIERILKEKDKIKSLEINELQTQINVTPLEDRKRRWMSDSQNSLREFYKTDVILMSESLSTTLKELQQELIEEVIQLVFWFVDSGYSKHMTGDLSLLRNFIEKFIGTVRFGNDHFTAITGYGDYEEVVPKVDDVSLVDGVFNGAFGGDGEDDFVMGEDVVVTSSLLEMLTKSCLGGMMVSLIFLEELEEEA